MAGKSGRVENIRRWISRLSVKKKLIFYGYLIISPVLFLICIVLSLTNYDKVVSEKLENDISGVNSLAESVSILQTDVKDISTYICINNEIHNLLTADNPEELNGNARLWLEYAPMQIVQDMISLKGHVKTIAIYPENGLRPYLRCMDGSAYVADIDMVRQSEIYQKTLTSDNGMVWKIVEKGSGETYETNRYDKVVLYREVFDLTRKKTLGYIVIGIKQDAFDTMCEQIIQGEEESVLILDKNGGELSRVGEIDEAVEKYLTSQEFMDQSYKEREVHFAYGGYEVTCNQKSENASIVCKIVPRYNWQTHILDIVYMPGMLLLGMLAGLLPLLLVISNIVTKPLKELSTAIDKFSHGDFEQQVEVTTEDEVGEVARCFNRMVGDIRTLIDENYVITLKEKESELAALQAQINPHFLYNTLDSLYWQAMAAEQEEIAESILALSQLFRLVLNQGRKELTVGQETELISRYLQIQKLRFEKRLSYEIIIEDEIKKAKVPKLILQPFVENAIVHGFENVTVGCRLTVIGKKEGDFIRFEVRDTGMGMRQDQIDAIWEEKEPQYAKQRIGRYAIKNIKERLQLKYKDNFSLEIVSRVGHGTTVILLIPFEGDE